MELAVSPARVLTPDQQNLVPLAQHKVNSQYNLKSVARTYHVLHVLVVIAFITPNISYLELFDLFDQFAYQVFWQTGDAVNCAFNLFYIWLKNLRFGRKTPRVLKRFWGIDKVLK